MLTMENVTKDYGKFTALEEFSLTFDSGVYGLLAPNGAGKTTLMKLLTTLLFPTKGEIMWSGTNIHDLGEEYRDLLGYLPQHFGYYKHQTPKQFLRYLSALKGLSDPDDRIEELLELVALEEVTNKKMRKFSGGMIQRVGIAQALLNDPKILILDEPTAGLDPKERVRFRNLLHNLSKDRIILLSTHIVSDVETIANQIVLMKDKKLLSCSPVADTCSLVAGTIFEQSSQIPLPDDAVLLSDKQTEGGAVVRYSSKNPPPSATEVSPNLEDVFLSIYRDEDK